MSKKYLSRREVPNHYPLSFGYLARLASSGRGPQYLIVANKALYRPSDIEEWIESRTIYGHRKHTGRPRKSRRA